MAAIIDFLGLNNTFASAPTVTHIGIAGVVVLGSSTGLGDRFLAASLTRLQPARGQVQEEVGRSALLG